MKLLLLFLGLSALCSTLCIGAQTTVKTYESEQGLFSVQMPGPNPQEKKTNDGYAQNGQVISSVGQFTYIVTYTYSCADLTKSGTRKSVIDDTRRNINAKKDHKIISEETINPEMVVNGRKATFDGYLFVAESNVFRITYRLYFALSKVYLLMIVKPNGSPDPPEVVEFFNSFTPVLSEFALSSVKARFPNGYPSMNEVVTKGKARHLTEPPYPHSAQNKQISGKVMIKIGINEKGETISAEPVCGDPELVPMSRAAALESRFAPTLLGGVPVKVTGFLTYNYSLR